MTSASSLPSLNTNIRSKHWEYQFPEYDKKQIEHNQKLSKSKDNIDNYCQMYTGTWNVIL